MKYSYEYVYDYFKNLGLTLLTKKEDYESVKTRIEYRCKCGETSYTTFDSFRSQQCTGCPKCGRKRAGKTKTATYEDAVSIIQLDGNKLLIDKNEFKDSNSIIWIECQCGNKFSSTLSRYKRLTYKCCEKCTSEIKQKKQIEKIKNIIEKDGNKFISCIKENKKYIVTFECVNCSNHETIVFEHYKVKKHKMCVNCARQKNFEALRKYTIEQVKDIFKENGYELLEDKFISIDTPMSYICNNGHRGTTSLYHFLEGSRCKRCYLENNKGENHWNWKGGVTPESEKIRKSDKYQIWRTKVFERDNYTCQACGKYGGKLHAHHIENFHKHEDKRFDVDNGITLCEECHSPNYEGSFHNIYGTKNNNRKQLEEFLKLKRKDNKSAS